MQLSWPVDGIYQCLSKISRNIFKGDGISCFIVRAVSVGNGDNSHIFIIICIVLCKDSRCFDSRFTGDQFHLIAES